MKFAPRLQLSRAVQLRPLAAERGALRALSARQCHLYVVASAQGCSVGGGGAGKGAPKLRALPTPSHNLLVPIIRGLASSGRA